MKAQVSNVYQQQSPQVSLSPLVTPSPSLSTTESLKSTRSFARFGRSTFLLLLSAFLGMQLGLLVGSSVSWKLPGLHALGALWSAWALGAQEAPPLAVDQVQPSLDPVCVDSLRTVQNTDPWETDLPSLENVTLGNSSHPLLKKGITVLGALALPQANQVVLIVRPPDDEREGQAHPFPPMQCKVGAGDWVPAVTQSNKRSYRDVGNIICNATVARDRCYNVSVRLLWGEPRGSPVNNSGTEQPSTTPPPQPQPTEVFGEYFVGSACDLGFSRGENDIVFMETLKPVSLELGANFATCPIKLVTTWIEYYLRRGADKIMVYLHRYTRRDGPDWRPFWLALLEPFRASGRVNLLFLNQQPPKDVKSFYRWSLTQQCFTNSVSRFLLSGRAKWGGNHDIDEFIFPHPEGTWGAHGINLFSDMLAMYPPRVNLVSTNMMRVTYPPTQGDVVLRGEYRALGFMPKNHKVIWRVDACAIPWVHWCTRFEDGLKEETLTKEEKVRVPVMRLNHYRKDESKKDNIPENDKPTIPYYLGGGEADPLLQCLSQRLGGASLWSHVQEVSRPFAGTADFAELPSSVLEAAVPPPDLHVVA